MVAGEKPGKQDAPMTHDNVKHRKLDAEAQREKACEVAERLVETLRQKAEILLKCDAAGQPSQCGLHLGEGLLSPARKGRALSKSFDLLTTEGGTQTQDQRVAPLVGRSAGANLYHQGQRDALHGELCALERHICDVEGAQTHSANPMA